MADDGVTVNLTVTANQAAPRIPLKIAKDTTGLKLREVVSEATTIPLSSLRLIYRGKLIGVKDDDKNAVEEFKLEEGSVLHCMGKPSSENEVSSSMASSAQTPSAAAVAGSSVTMQNQAQAPAPATASSRNSVEASLNNLRSLNPPATYLTAVTTLDKVLSNIVTHPMEEKYRRVKKANAAFSKRLGSVPGGAEAILACGFNSETQDGEEVFMMEANADKWPELMKAKADVEKAVQEAKSAANQPSAPPQMPSGMPNFGNLPGMDGSGMTGGMGADVQTAAARMMSDPNVMRSMLQNPMVQNMIRNDPRFANNPMLQQSIEQLANNPQMLQQVSQMMQDPNMQRQMQQMQSMMGGVGDGMPGMPPGGMPNFNFGGGQNNNTNGAGNAQQQQQGSSNGGGGGNDAEMTEEEMIAEAIRRSLEEGN